MLAEICDICWDIWNTVYRELCDTFICIRDAMLCQSNLWTQWHAQTETAEAQQYKE